MRPEFEKAIRNHKYDLHESGLFLPKQGVIIGGVFEHDVLRNGEWLGVQRDHNLMVTEGLKYILSAALNDGTKVATWYVALFKGDYTPVATLTAATFASAATELTEYDNVSVHPTYADDAVTSTAPILVTNSTKAQFTISATVTAYGAALVSVSTRPTPTSGNTLLCASRFSAARSLVDNDELYITYTITAADA
jgi:hypothetical protein